MPSAEAPALAWRDVDKAYGPITALDGFHLEVHPGEILGLLGPNGAGKTTAIKILMGLVEPDDGSVRALGEEAPSRDLLPRIGYMPQKAALYEDLSVDEHVELFAELHGLEAERARERGAELLELVGLTGRRQSLAHELSGGMRNRLSLALALLNDPEVLLLDEPTVGVDPVLRARFWERFRALRDAGKTVLVTTHYMDEARHCDRVALMREGQRIALGTVGEVLEAVGEEDLEDAFLQLAGTDEGSGEHDAAGMPAGGSA